MVTIDEIEWAYTSLVMEGLERPHCCQASLEMMPWEMVEPLFEESTEEYRQYILDQLLKPLNQLFHVRYMGLN